VRQHPFLVGTDEFAPSERRVIKHRFDNWFDSNWYRGYAPDVLLPCVFEYGQHSFRCLALLLSTLPTLPVNRVLNSHLDDCNVAANWYLYTVAKNPVIVPSAAV